MSESPRYVIETLLDFIKVPEARRSACLKEFHTWIEIADGFTLGTPMQFIWTDDGKTTVTVRPLQVDTRDAG